MAVPSGSQSAPPSDQHDEPYWWRRPLIWAVFLALLYLLREFFLIGFLTFLACFVVRGAVGFLARRLASGGATRRQELMLTLLVFLAICLSLYGLGRYFVPRAMRQGKSLIALIETSSPEAVQNTVLANTVGTWAFKRKFGSPQDEEYTDAFHAFQAAGRDGEGLYQAFPQLNSRLRAEFEAKYEKSQVQYLKTQGGAAPAEFEQWFLKVKAPELFHQKREYYLSRWQAAYASPDKADELETVKQRPDFEAYRDGLIYQEIWRDLQADPVLLARDKDQWAVARATSEWAKFRRSDDYQAQFERFYQERRDDNPAAAPIDFAFYQSLAAAYPEGEDAFLAAVRRHYSSASEPLAHQRHDFETATKLELGRQWWATSHVADWLREHAKSDGPRFWGTVSAWFNRAATYLVRVPLQVATSLALSIFILLEWHTLKEGAASLRSSRLQPVFDEVAPGVVALGRLIGKTFQGQVVIATFNALVTLIALWLIGVEYRYVLALIAFVFSFIPVVGVMLSGAPMCFVAVCQPGGSVWMALQVIGAIVLIHAAEAFVLSPRILGKIGHLHPVLVIPILLVAEHFFGMWGLVLGVPVAIYLIQAVLLNAPIPGIYEPKGDREAAA
ncbi:MAG: AI-2E family transporter [Planctomycetota bacterium]